MMTHVPFDKTAIEQPFTTRFSTIARDFADHNAVISATETLTYRTLERQAEWLAHAIVERLGTENEPVLLLLPHDTTIIVSIVAALKANKAYVAIDPSAPPTHLTALQEQIQARLLITTSAQLLALADPLPSGIAILIPDTGVATDHPLAPALPPIHWQASSLPLAQRDAPKAFNAPIVSSSTASGLRAITIKSVQMNGLPCSYRASSGASMADLGNALLNGAALCLFDLPRQSLAQLTLWLHTTQITHLHLPIQLYRQWLASLTPSDHFATIRQVVPSGQQIRSDYARGWQHFGADCHFVSRFASSETGLVARLLVSQQTQLETEVTPVGTPIPDKEVYLVDEQGQPVATGKIGEIVVQSRYLALGYWQQPDLTRQKFKPVPKAGVTRYDTGDFGRMRPDGCLEFLGRKDEMVKIRGYRVELGEVEAALYTLPMVKAAAVVTHKRPGTAEPAGEPEIIAYLVPNTQPAPTTSALRTALAATLPDHMIPTQFILLQQLPMTPNGKIDRKALPPLDDKTYRERPLLDTPYAPPYTPLEETLVNIWQAVLGVEPIGIDDHFLDLGSNSLRAMQVHARLLNQMQSDLPAHLLFACTTVAEMALLLIQQQATQVDQEALAQMLMVLETAPN